MKNYIEEAVKTESLKTSFVEERLLHAAIGVSTEISEFILADPEDRNHNKEELGDILWYCALAADELEITFDEMVGLIDGTKVDPMETLITTGLEALDLMKKTCFYGRPLNRRDIAIRFAGVLVSAIQLAWFKFGWTLDEVQEKNIAKLRTRYGEKFTSEAAENRDLEAEMSSLN